MSEVPDEPFTASLRAGPITVSLGTAEAPRLTFRVQLLERWDAVKVAAPGSEPVLSVKVATLAVLDPAADFHDDYVVKHRGIEVLDENASLDRIGVLDGGTLSLSLRRRRAVR